MKIAWESSDWPGAHIETNHTGITCLTWMPIADRPGEGMLGVGSDTGSVGITLTSDRPIPDDHQRYNFNLRGHHAKITMVRWNHAQNKLASCDAAGVIYVWTRNDDRWSVELVNDRGVKVRDLSWSPCGQYALICYEDNFVLVGSSTGQRIWSQPYIQTHQVICGTFSADPREIVLGFEDGTIQVLHFDGGIITERKITHDRIEKLAFTPEINGKWILAVYAHPGKLLMMTAYDQAVFAEHRESLDIQHWEWNSDGTLLGCIDYYNRIQIFDTQAREVHREFILSNESLQRVSAFTWANNGKTVIAAACGQTFVGTLLPGIPKLFTLVTLQIWKNLGKNGTNVASLPLPSREKEALKELDHHVIRCRVPRPEDVTAFACAAHDERTYCTIRPWGVNSYMLCMEHMGGLVPLLIGRQVNRFLPQFYISAYPEKASKRGGSSAQVEDASLVSRGSTGRNSLWRRSKRQLRAIMSRHVSSVRPTIRSDTRLVHISSNIWCTRFHVSSLAPSHLPHFLAQIVYKTSVLHLQPRQMTIQLANLDKQSTTRTSSIQHSNEAWQSAATHTTISEDDTEDEFAHLLSSSRLEPTPEPADTGLTDEERMFFDRVISECASLRAAMELAAPSTSALPRDTSFGPTSTVSTTLSSSSTQAAMHSLSPTLSPSMSQAEVGSLATSALSWQEEVDSMEFIDGADDTVMLYQADRSQVRHLPIENLKQRNKNQTTNRFIQWRKSQRAAKIEKDDIRTHLDKLTSIAEQLSKRHTEFNANRDRASIRKMRGQMKELLQRVNEIEKKVTGSDVRDEVRALVRTIEDMKRALGEGGKLRQLPANMHTLSNKTPLWNEQNQVYQLDFGGRVTQESAKNFQIEVDGRQVLQFGRIEGGAFTLDFRTPFCAAQAFAVALASITQRLK